jgi:hypothetical protein
MVKRHRIVQLVLGATLCLVTSGGLATARPVEADAQITNLQVSTGVKQSSFEPTGNVGTDFPGHNDGVWVTFAYQDVPPGSVLTRLVRFGGTDYNWDNDQYGYLDCCTSGGSGRYGFRVLRLDGDAGDLPGGDYVAYIYLNGAQVGQVNFGINGAGGRNDEIPGRPNNNEKTHNDNDATPE